MSLRQPPTASHLRALALLIACSAALIACGVNDRAKSPRLVLLYATCTLNASFLSPYSEQVTSTPALGRFAEQSVVFERHHTEAGQSGIAFASLLSGAGAEQHGIYRHPATLSDDVLLISEAFAEGGYETYAWTHHPMASPSLGYMQGIPPQNVHMRKLFAKDPAFTKVLQRLRDDPELRVFIFTNFTVTHGPYKDPYLSRYLQQYESRSAATAEEERLIAIHHMNNKSLSWSWPEASEQLGLVDDTFFNDTATTETLYASNVNYLDRLFEQAVDTIEAHGLGDESLIAFTADHGELLHRSNALFQFSHAMQLAPEVIRVPLIVRAPGLSPGRYTGVSRSIDVMPTLLGLAGLPSPSGPTGVDLSSALPPDSEIPELSAWSHSSVLVRSVARAMHDERRAASRVRLREYFPDEDPDLIWAAVRMGDLLFRMRGRAGKDWRFEAFDMATDPGETRDLFDPSNPDHAANAVELKRYREGLVADYRRRVGDAGEPLLPQSEEYETLKSLGYVE